MAVITGKGASALAGGQERRRKTHRAAGNASFLRRVFARRGPTGEGAAGQTRVVAHNEVTPQNQSRSLSPWALLSYAIVNVSIYTTFSWISDTLH